MRIAIIDESAARAAVIEEGLRSLPDCNLLIITERHAIVAKIAEFAPDVVMIDLGNPSRDTLEEYFAVTRVLDRPIAMFVDQSDGDAIGDSIDAGVSAYIVDGMAAPRIRTILELAMRRYRAFSHLQRELDDARGELARRAAVDQAKRVLMTTNGISEPEAYAMLRKHAMNNGQRIGDFAQALVAAQSLLKGG
ncbi:MAG: ANTAR domain-containing protein [Sphingomonadales bacterium]|nr:ANTAR domain-containing protein [Sphingomonadales bacterium]